tara:strand:- start:1305 stop:1808 length:504 start_codon:yes stop_codon:yes gene_type:complete
MNLRTRKELAAKVLKVGKNRIQFAKDNLNEIKEAITKQDMKDLHKEGFISIKPIKGRKKIKKRKTRRGPGKIKKKVNKRKQIYVKITRKLRSYLKELKSQEKISNELFWGLRKKIRMREFRSKSHLKEHLVNVSKIDLNKEVVKPKKKTVKKTEKKAKPKKTKEKKK